MATNTVKLELAKLLDDDKHRSILYLLDLSLIHISEPTRPY